METISKMLVRKKTHWPPWLKPYRAETGNLVLPAALNINSHETQLAYSKTEKIWDKSIFITTKCLATVIQLNSLERSSQGYISLTYTKSSRDNLLINVLVRKENILSFSQNVPCIPQNSPLWSSGLVHAILKYITQNRKKVNSVLDGYRSDLNITCQGIIYYRNLVSICFYLLCLVCYMYLWKSGIQPQSASKH